MFNQNGQHTTVTLTASKLVPGQAFESACLKLLGGAIEQKSKMPSSGASSCSVLSLNSRPSIDHAAMRVGISASVKRDGGF